MSEDRENKLAGSADGSLAGLADTMAAFDSRKKSLESGESVTSLGWNEALNTGKNLGGSQVNFTYDKDSSESRPNYANSSKDTGFYSGSGSNLTINDMDASSGAGGYAKSGYKGVSIPNYTIDWSLLSSLTQLDGINKVVNELLSIGGNTLFNAASMLSYEKLCLLLSSIFGGTDDDVTCVTVSSFSPTTINATQTSWLITLVGKNFDNTTVFVFQNSDDASDQQAVYPEKFTVYSCSFDIGDITASCIPECCNLVYVNA